MWTDLKLCRESHPLWEMSIFIICLNYKQVPSLGFISNTKTIRFCLILHILHQVFLTTWKNFLHISVPQTLTRICLFKSIFFYILVYQEILWSRPFLMFVILLYSIQILKPSEKKAKYQYGGLNSGRPVTPPRGPQKAKGKK